MDEASLRTDLFNAGLVAVMADGAIHSGAGLAGKFSCSRTTIWKRLRDLKSVGLDIESLAGRGYRLARPLELLSQERILESMNPAVRDTVASIVVHSITDSTSESLKLGSAPPPGKMFVVLAEYQTDGRGRRGRRWVSPYGSGLCLSVSWSFDTAPAGLPGLSLVAGIAVIRAAQQLQIPDIGLKWPNDVVAKDAKAGGILVDVQGESGGPLMVTIGIGLNIDVTPRLKKGLAGIDGLPPIGLRSLVPGGTVSRNDVAAKIIIELGAVLSDFGRDGFGQFAAEWRRYDALNDRLVAVEMASATLTGVARGIADDGSLLLARGDEILPLVSGEVSLRLQSQPPSLAES
jgi:BirA family biotin operon repressor/biotin-[acetyl-CoA-carboxylase] ligase